MNDIPTHGGCSSASRTRARRLGRAFTLMELMVAVTLLTLVMLAISEVFSYSSQASGVTTSHVEMLQRMETLVSTIETDLQTMAPGMLIIDSPSAIAATDIEDPSGAEATLLAAAAPPVTYRSDALVFFSAGAPGLHESQWTYRNIAGNNVPVSSGEAIVHYGHAWVSSNPPMGTIAMSGPAINWKLYRRAIVLDAARTTPTVRPGGTALSALYPWGGFGGEGFDTCTADILYPRTLVDEEAAFRSIVAGSRSSGNVTSTTKQWTRSAYERSLDPGPVTAATQGQACFLLANHLGDFIVEWTDGTVDINTGQLVWYGQARDVDRDTSTWLTGQGGGVEVVAKTDDSGNSIPPNLGTTFEVQPTSTTPGSAYTAVWDASTWSLRPKALRITVRLYDPQRRLTEQMQLTDNAGKRTGVATRYGREYTFVIAIP